MKLGFGRRVASLYAYLPLIHFSRQRTALGKMGLRWIVDPVLAAKVLEIKARTTGVSPSEEERLQGLYAILGLAMATRPIPLDPRNLEVFGTKLSDIPDASVRALLMAFLQSQEYSLKKEEVCWAVWRLSYDPIPHDGKIYKLIHRARTFFPGKDLFVNTYGGYRLKLQNGKNEEGRAS